jgi:septal ring factor EnvC (AmiA/AmiB activator)
MVSPWFIFGIEQSLDTNKPLLDWKSMLSKENFDIRQKHQEVKKQLKTHDSEKAIVDIGFSEISSHIAQLQEKINSLRGSFTEAPTQTSERSQTIIF